MHVYAINSNKRETVIKIIFGLDILISFVIEYFHLIDMLWGLFHIDTQNSVFILFNIFLNVFVPLSIYGIFYWIYNKFLWKWGPLRGWHEIPDLNGRWEGKVTSPLKNQPIDITVNIEQTWDKIKISTRTNSQAQSQSAMLEILENGTVYLRYSFITKRQNQEYPGYNRLELNGDILDGEYFTAKTIPGMDGYGSKGNIRVKKVSN